MIHHCPRCAPAVPVIWQPSKLRYYCPKCHQNFEPRALRLIAGGLSAAPVPAESVAV